MDDEIPRVRSPIAFQAALTVAKRAVFFLSVSSWDVANEKDADPIARFGKRVALLGKRDVTSVLIVHGYSRVASEV
jgi:hypothetical protein